jgi:hypothetical protein
MGSMMMKRKMSPGERRSWSEGELPLLLPC